ncbi:AP-1 complex-associated regulatory isoform X1 [Pelobates cultripes]|uniref:AP-1 complex-associated regulatory isoform X1 n=1 Tax=Pelobates cultripes TaxID=61616 RepID=A0AAD1S1A4_PELCU|nr:AP-1 complex-associated regulatory isoform X1 [Pelobates cultripes]
MTLIPASLTILSLNARGLNKPEKRATALRDFHSASASIVYLQETHFKEGSRPKLHDHRYPTGYFSDYHGGKARGTAILLHKRVPLQEMGVQTDREGRFVFLKGTIAGQIYTFANIYVPNQRHYRFLSRTFRKLQLALQEEKLKLEEEALYAAQREAARAATKRKLLEQHRLQWLKQRAQAFKSGENMKGSEDFESYLQNVKSQYEVFRSSRLSSDANILTPNTESSCDLTNKTKSTSGNDDNTSLDLEWEDEEGINRLIPMRERSKTEEDILRAALTYSRKKPGSHAASASDDSNGLEWENDFVSAEMDDNGNSEYAGFVNPVTEQSAEHQDR